MRADDLAPLLAPGRGDPAAIRGGKGTVIEWNPLTGENVIRFRGTDLVDLPIVASSSELLLIQPGDQVLLHIFGNGGVATIYIVGRVTVPGSPEARAAILNALADNIFSATVTTAQSTGSATFTDLGTVGPVVSNVPIGASGRALIYITANIFASKPSDATDIEGIMSYAISGATSRNPSDDEALRLGHNNIPAGAIYGRKTAVSLAENLTPGSTTFTAKYRIQTASATQTVIFSVRNLTVIAF